MIEPLVSFPDFFSFSSGLREHYSRPSMKRTVSKERIDLLLAEAELLNQQGLPPLVSPTALALILGISPRLLTAMTTSPERYWRVFEIPKKSGGRRRIIAPRVFLKTVQSYLLRFVFPFCRQSESAFGFSKGKSALANAEIHLGQKFVWNTDLEDFFPSISRGQVQDALKQLPFPIEVINLLSGLCTYKNFLPQGAPTSPALSNIVFFRLDTELAAFAVAQNFRYTRYADDITLSGPNLPNKEMLLQLDRALRFHGFTQNAKKVRLYGATSAQYVTGYVTNQVAQPDRRTRRMVRAMIHNLSLEQNPRAEAIGSAQGWASYVHGYNPALGSSYLQKVAEAQKRSHNRQELSTHSE